MKITSFTIGPIWEWPVWPSEAETLGVGFQKTIPGVNGLNISLHSHLLTLSLLPSLRCTKPMLLTVTAVSEELTPLSGLQR